MTKVVVDETLEFEFEGAWKVIRWDAHSAYRKGIERAGKPQDKGRPGAGAVDLVCWSGDAVLLLEVKDYRNFPRNKASDLIEELVRKVSDTLAGVIGAARQEHHKDEFLPVATRLTNPKHKLFVVLWLEQGRFVGGLGPVGEQLQRHFGG